MGTSQKSSAEDKNNIGFSEIERSNVLENKDWQPFGKKIFGRGGGKSIPL